MKEKLKERKGITLIALVITIIVLLILAGVSIATLTGQNGILLRTNEAKEQTERAEIIERAQTDILGVQAGNETASVSRTELKTLLDKYFIELPEDYTLETEITAKSEYGSHKMKVSDIYKGTLTEKGITAEEIANATDKSQFYGAIVNGYELPNGTTTDVGWKIFYADNSNIYLIADNYVERENLPNSTTEDGVMTVNRPKGESSSQERTAYFSNILGDYNTGSARITDSRLKALNNSYFNDKNLSSTNNNMKAVAYMMDTTAWNSKFKDVNNKAEYAIGGPTVEMLMKSYSQKHGVDYQARARGVVGYEISKDKGANWSTGYSGMLDTNDSLYVIKDTTKASAMWVASPSAYNPTIVMNVGSSGEVDNYGFSNIFTGFRPLVCLKSDIQLQKNADGTYNIK